VLVDRIRGFRHTLEDRAAERREETAVAVGLFVDSLAEIYDLNYLRARTASATALAEEAEHLMERFLHRKVVADAAGDELAPGFVERGWVATEHLVMAHLREPDRRVDTSAVREVNFEDLAPVRSAVAESEYDDRRLAEQLNEAKRRTGRAMPTRWFALVDSGTIAAYCELLTDGTIAQIEDVNTLVPFRGRGYGRTIVQHALDVAKDGHEVVFLEAVADDWPWQLYAKLGFEPVDRRHLFLLPPSALTRLRLRTSRLELRLPTVAELRELAGVAQQGVHDPTEMPFEVPWTDWVATDSFVDDFIAYHRGALANSTPVKWRLELVAFRDGRPIGVQALAAEQFKARREVATGSWIGAAWQGLGLGTEMRSAVLTLAFDGLGAETAVSAAWERNSASLAVSRKLGYRPGGTKISTPRGEPLVHVVLRLVRGEFRRAGPVEIDGLRQASPLLGGGVA
jgi:RimJ/RimL family protein N-acetyltransferase/ribosomal protein S18 acetylase RimI-like enzyme